MKDEHMDYSKHHFSKGDFGKHCLFGMGYFFLLGMIFFHHIGLAFIGSFGVVAYVKEQRRLAIKKRKKELLLQFREGMYALASSLSAGRAVEQAFIQAHKDLSIVYNEQTDIVMEWQIIVHKIAMNETIESALIDFSNRSELDDIHNFVNVFVMAKKSGGDLVKIIKETTNMINEKIEIQKEIDVLITQKKFEQQILSYIIPGMILFFSLTSPGFLEPLYSGVIGRMIMSLALVLYIVSGRIGRKIVEIEV